LPLIICEFGPTYEDTPGNLRTTGTSTMPLLNTATPIPIVGVTTNDMPLPTQTQASALPDVSRAKALILLVNPNDATNGYYVQYTNFSGSQFTGCTATSIATGSTVTSIPTGLYIFPRYNPVDRVGYALNLLNWVNVRNAGTAVTPATRTSPRHTNVIAWNWATVGSAGPELLAAGAYATGAPTNWGKVFKDWTPV